MKGLNNVAGRDYCCGPLRPAELESRSERHYIIFHVAALPLGQLLGRQRVILSAGGSSS